MRGGCAGGCAEGCADPAGRLCGVVRADLLVESLPAYDSRHQTIYIDLSMNWITYDFSDLQDEGPSHGVRPVFLEVPINLWSGGVPRRCITIEKI